MCACRFSFAELMKDQIPTTRKAIEDLSRSEMTVSLRSRQSYHAHRHTHTHTSAHTYTHIHTYIHTHAHTRAHTHTYTHTHTHAHTHAHM